MPVNTLRSPGALGSILVQPLPHCVMLEASEPPNPLLRSTPLSGCQGIQPSIAEEVEADKEGMERVLSSWKGVTEWLFLETASAVPVSCSVPIQGGTTMLCLGKWIQSWG